MIEGKKVRCVPVTEQPDTTAETEVLASDRTDTLAVTNRAKVEVGRADSPGLATPAEADGGRRRARVRVVTLAGVVHLRARDLRVEGLNCRGRAVDDGGSRVDDGLEVVDGGGGANDGLGTSCLPESGRGVDGVVLDRARVLGGVGATEVEVRAGGGELEAKGTGGDLALVDGSIKERVLAKVGDRGEGETEDTINRVAGEGRGESGDGREVLASHGEAGNGDYDESSERFNYIR